ncbi:MAG: 50S ribosomal protein L9 [Phycisphaerae bacterium]|nr:50S ribosomal protein L9 [Planctomycetota bacterium]MBL7220451.1 50S ribosomal protein L9 [Phycisphaerae bacterium]
MQVLLRQNVRKLGQIGDLVNVKPGYARNYLLPQGIAIAPTKANLKIVEAERQRHLEELAKMREELEAKAAVVKGKEITISARANEEGHLYGSIGPAQIEAALASENIFIDAKYIELDHPIRQLDKYDVQIRFSPDIASTIHVWVLPSHDSDKARAPEPAEYDSGDAGDDQLGEDDLAGDDKDTPDNNQTTEDIE